MKIIITESQFKRLIENIIKEQEDNYDVFDDPKAQILVDYLNDKSSSEEFGFVHIEKINYSRAYFIDYAYRVKGKKFLVIVEPEDSSICNRIAQLDFVIDAHKYKGHCIFKVF